MLYSYICIYNVHCQFLFNFTPQLPRRHSCPFLPAFPAALSSFIAFRAIERPVRCASSPRLSPWAARLDAASNGLDTISITKVRFTATDNRKPSSPRARRSRLGASRGKAVARLLSHEERREGRYGDWFPFWRDWRPGSSGFTVPHEASRETHCNVARIDSLTRCSTNQLC